MNEFAIFVTFCVSICAGPDTKRLEQIHTFKAENETAAMLAARGREREALKKIVDRYGPVEVERTSLAQIGASCRFVDKNGKLTAITGYGDACRDIGLDENAEAGNW